MHKDLLRNAKQKTTVNNAVHRYLFQPRVKGQSRQLKESFTVRDLWIYWHSAWLGRGLSAASVSTTRKAIDEEQARIIREVQILDEASIDKLESMVDKWGLDVVLVAIDMCAGNLHADLQPTLDDLRKYLYSAQCDVNRQLLARRMGS